MNVVSAPPSANDSRSRVDLRCPAVMVSAPASGQGKTSVTAALARSQVRRGRRVQVFKIGPDFIDPTILEAASGRPVYQLDLFMGSDAHCRALLYEAAARVDLILVEGAMGLFDGAPSTADLAAAFRLPILVVIDANAMAQTFGAVAHGLASFRPGLAIAGVVANRVASAGHARMVGDSLAPGLELACGLQQGNSLTLPERHLGLVQAGELAYLEDRIDRLADAWDEGGGAAFEAAAVSFEAPAPDPSSSLDALRGVRIAVARDEAFSFIYAANIDVLRALGAEVVMFSPLADASVPDCDALWLPGGYPELHATGLAANREMLASVREHHANGRPLLAECGGALYLMDGLTTRSSTDVNSNEARYAFAGVLPGEARMNSTLAAIGLQEVVLPEGLLRGHSFHYSSLDSRLLPIVRARCPNGGRTAEAVYRVGSTTASYMHFYFASNPETVARLFRPAEGGK